MRKYILWRLLWLTLFLAVTVSAWAQSADFVANYAARERVRGDETVFLLAIATGMIPADAAFTPESVASATLPVAGRFASDQPLSLAGLAYLITRYLDIRSGLMGRLLPGPRYALRDLRHERIVLYEANPQAPVPGGVALRTIRRAIEWSTERAADEEVSS